MNIGLISNDSKKELMQNFCIAYKGILSHHNLFATGSTGSMIEDVANLSVHKFIPGQLGGIRQMAAQIECNEMDAIIFLRDPSTADEESQKDFIYITKLCDISNIPLATNLATAEMLVLGIERGDLSWRDLYK